MEQKLYKYETVLLLLKGENHLRGIAKELKINHMTIKRILDSLVKENVSDVRSQGRNNVFTIKKTMEAQNIVIMAEIYKFNKLIMKHPELKQGMLELKKLKPKLIVLFGSYAKETETRKSDIDIYLDTKDPNIGKKASSINRKFSIKVGSYSRENILIKEIERNHIIIKGYEEFYEKNKLFN